MRSIRVRILAICAVLIVAGVGAWQLLPSGEVGGKPITVGTVDEVTSLDPAGAYDAGSWALFSNLYQTLMTFKSGAIVPEPDAAESCEFIGQKLTTYRCKLRDDLTFSNGHKITAKDVKYSFDRMMKINSDVGPAILFPGLRNVVTEGREITFNLSARDATFPAKLATGAGAIVDPATYPKEKLRTDNKVDGSGPYTLKSYEDGVKASMTPNARYKGVIKNVNAAIDVRYYDTSDKLLAAWKAGDLDVTHRQLPPAEIAKINPADPNVQITEMDSAEIRNLVFNVRPGATLSDKRIRQAIAWTIDRGPLVGDVYDSTVEPLYSLIPQGFIGHSTPFFDTYPQPDVNKAKELLQEAGVETPVAITYAFRPDGATTVEAAELKRQLEKDGLFKVTVKPTEWQAFQKGYAAGKYDAYTVGWLPDFPDPDTFGQPLVGTDNSLHNGYSNSRLDALVTDTQGFEDRSRTSNDFKEIQKIVGEDVPLVPLWQKKDYVIAKTGISGSQYLSDGTGLWRLWELKRI
ncbi:ABC transporter substrate-binding protein [Streptomyces sp. NBC_00102]|uniref:ABC transporter substrate-binding protein n=1 Tax=Streptomyces sp. NBC_00102 TaxID=2975652 RepID=UPI002259A261|nr:ABC transporter substrate-binding protein [Streptomyces sp. NBC_00102]MCX5399274.1 ABC transporter substrate-binding protein [Streptomyces sp. NBC_00102]